MASWEKVLRQTMPHTDEAGNAVAGLSADALRQKYVSALAAQTGRNVIVYYSGFLSGLSDNTSINDTDMTGFINAMEGLDRGKGLDLILHTPGGDPNAAEAIVSYLHSMFGNDLRIIVPQIAMSAGTMMSCAAHTVLMAKHSSLGPVDPQFSYYGLPAFNVVQMYAEAKEDLENNPNSIQYWSLIFSKLPPGFLYSAYDAIERSNILVGQWLRQYMFAGESGKDLDNKIRRIRNKLNSNNMSHGCHFSYDFCKNLGMKVEELEADPEMYDLVMGVHNAFLISIEVGNITKIIQNHDGACYMTLQGAQEE